MRLGVSATTLKRHVPELRRAVSQRYREWGIDEERRRHNELTGEIYQIAVKLVQQGLYPSSNRISELLRTDINRSWRVIGEAVREAQCRLKIGERLLIGPG
jgi:hypothetical protein